MVWKLIVAPRAERDVARLPPRDREAITRALELLPADPGRSDLKKLAGSQNRWRLRVGGWRVILELDNAGGTMRVLRVLPRGRAYRD